jgi:SM-20-related protein
MHPPVKPSHPSVCFENLITGLMEQGFGISEGFLDAPVLEGLRTNLLRFHSSGGMKPAGVGQNFDYKKNVAIRGDVIRWIDNDTTDPFELMLILRVRSFIIYLNASCYTGIDDFELHYAYYGEGSFYKRHIDRFRSDKGRQFSFVLYLNNDWKATNNGRLTLYVETGGINIYPEEGRVVFFRSDETEHEVHASAGRPRLSIAGWLKRG